MNELGSLFKIQFLGCIGERFASIEWIDASGAVIFEDGTRAELANGRHVEVKGRFDSASGTILAARIEFEN